MHEAASGDSGAPAGAAGRVYPPVEFRIEPKRVAAFARTIGADPKDGVPPTFAAVYSLGVTAPQLFGDEEVGIDFARLLHAEQEFEWQRHPEAGETVTSRGRIASDIARRGIRLVTFEVETWSGDGRPVCRSRSVFAIRQ